MSVTIQLSADEEARLREAARTRGLRVEDLARRLVSSQLPPVLADPTLALLEAWDREDATEDPEELAARRRDWEEVRDGLAANRLALRTPKV